MKALVFDLDDTLYPEREFVLSGFLAVDAWLQQHVGKSGFKECAAALYIAGHRGRIFDEVLHELAIDSSPELIIGMVHVYRSHLPTLALFLDASEALELWGARVPLGIITDGYLMTQRRKIEALGIATRFKTIIYSDEFGRQFWKPSTKPFERAMAAFSVKGRDCVYVADNPMKDFLGARMLGWRTVRVRRSGGEYAGLDPAPGEGADAEIGDLRALPEIIAKL